MSTPPVRVLISSTIPNLHGAIAAELLALPRALRREIELHAFPSSPAVRQSADVIVADPGRFTIRELPSLAWYQSTWAGVDYLFKAHPAEDGGLPDSTPAAAMAARGVVCTRLGGVFGDLMAEYVLGSILARELKLRDAAELQRHRTWDAAPFAGRRRLASLTMGVLGASGSIGGAVCASASALGMNVVGLASSRRGSDTAQGDRAVPKADGAEGAYTALPSLEDVLASSDYVVSILPSTKQTRSLLSGDALRACAERSPVLINVGRGDIIDEASLLNALARGWISGAVLDVFATEPLSSDSPLWGRPDVVITPHVSAPSLPTDVAKAFVANLARYADSELGEMKYRVDFERGY